MSQEINLYEDRLRPRRELASATNLALAALVLLVVMGVSVVNARNSAGKLQAELQGLQAEVKTEQARLTALGKTLSQKNVSPQILAEIEKTRSVLQTRRATMHLLELGELGNMQGFSRMFLAFSRQYRPGLWLTGLTVTQGGSEIEIRGRALDAGQLPAYMTRLADEPAFRGRRFAALDLRDSKLDETETGEVPGGAASPVATSSSTLGEFTGRLTSAPVPPANSTKPAPNLPRFTEFVLRSAKGEAPR